MATEPRGKPCVQLQDEHRRHHLNANEAPAAPPQAVFFDMDGLIIDSEPTWFATEVAVLASHGFHLGPEHYEHVLGKPAEMSMAYLVGVAGLPLTPPELGAIVEREMAAQLHQGVEFLPGAKDLLAELGAAGVPCALVSASSRLIVEAALASIGADNFAFSVSYDDVTRSKPFPEPYLKAAERLAVDPAKCVVLEDSPNGTAAGLASGCHVVAVPHSVPIEPGERVTVVDSLERVDLAMLRALFG